MKKTISFSLCSSFGLLLLLWASSLHAQRTAPVLGLHEVAAGCHAFVHADITVKPGLRYSNSTLLVRDGLVLAVGPGLNIPADAVVHDMKGAAILPGFVESYGLVNGKKDSKGGRGEGGPVYQTSKPGAYYWNEAVKPENDVLMGLDYDPKRFNEYLEAGFTAIHLLPDDGIFRGSSAVILPGKANPHEGLLVPRAAMAMSFKKGSSSQSYPESLMGAIALIRQVLADVEWYAVAKTFVSKQSGAKPVETNLSLEALIRAFSEKLPVFFECGDWQDVLRASKIAREYNKTLVFKTGWDIYKRAENMAALNASFIMGLDFPEPYDLSDPQEARTIPFNKLLEWEQAPRAPSIMRGLQVPISFTAHGLKKPKLLWESLAKAIRHGLDPDAALDALTLAPARLLGLEQQIGSLEAGKLANFVVYEEQPFRTCEPVVLETWTGINVYRMSTIPKEDYRGQYVLKAGEKAYSILIGGLATAPRLKVVVDKDTLKGELEMTGPEIRMSFPTQKGKEASNLTVAGVVSGKVSKLKGLSADGRVMDCVLDRTGSFQVDWKDKEKKSLELVDMTKFPALRFPAGAYGQIKLPTQGTWLIRRATVWTNTKQGIQTDVDVLIENGQIQAVGKSLRAPESATVVDANGRHLTPGIIDEHSHIAIRQGVNEGSHAVTAEVRIGDVLDGEDVNIYRQLAGGVTSSHLLHGSANPIGGQTQLIKLRWGAVPEDLKFEGAPGFIKFALGENVKQSNWGDRYRIRYPQTRMGVEQMIRDAFQAALDYKAKRDAASKSPTTVAPVRKDLQMETLLEILESRRFITCHSYVQSEILMLMRLAESFGFRINTFTHVLEGYKIAEEIKTHGASASSFSDWWAYKMEVQDAIPHNAALLSQKGVNVCLNSDDAEMARRLNQEAAKAVKYGGVSEEEALKMVTLNPAKALRVDEWVGSIEKGKSADLVLWSQHPLSVYTRADMTFVDGRLYFDRDQDAKSREWMASERKRILAKMAATPSKERRKAGPGDSQPQYHCETLESDYGHE